jgi:hypothetical protein
MRRFRLGTVFDERSPKLEEIKSLLKEFGIAIPDDTTTEDLLPALRTALATKLAMIEGDEREERESREKELRERQEDQEFYSRGGMAAMSLGRMKKMAAVATAYLNKADADRKAGQRQATENALFGAGGSPYLGSGPSNGSDDGTQNMVHQLFGEMSK